MILKANLEIFINYAKEDKNYADKIYTFLINNGYNVWYDNKNLLPGHDWDLEIQKAIRHSDVVLVLLSNNSVNKEGYVQKEIKLLLDMSDKKPEGAIFLIPIRIQECKIPIRLEKLQYVDYDKDGLELLLKSLSLREKQVNKD